jgi:hypothetical protein
MGKINKNPGGFKDYSDVIQTANEAAPVTLETIRDLMHRHNLKTKHDVMFFVLMNYIRSIDESLNKDLESTYLRRIQDNFLLAAEKFLK